MRLGLEFRQGQVYSTLDSGGLRPVTVREAFEGAVALGGLPAGQEVLARVRGEAATERRRAESARREARIHAESATRRERNAQALELQLQQLARRAAR